MKQDTLQILGTIWVVGSIICHHAVAASLAASLMMMIGAFLLVASLFCKEEK